MRCKGDSRRKQNKRKKSCAKAYQKSFEETKVKSLIEENIPARSQLTWLKRGQRDCYNIDDACLKETVKVDFIRNEAEAQPI